MLVVDMPLELIQGVIRLSADLARVESANLDGHILGSFNSTAFDMLLDQPFRLERFLTFWALIVSLSIQFWIV